MKKVLLAFDGIHFPDGAFRFIQRMNENEKILVVAAVLPTLSRSVTLNMEPLAEGIAYGTSIIREYEEMVEKTVLHFQHLCVQHDIEYRTHKDYTADIFESLKKESRFSDLMILGSESFYNDLGTDDVNSYLDKALRIAECPVLLIPDKFDYPEKIVLAFDGSTSSLYALRQFAYLFPEYTRLPATLVYFDESSEDIPDLPYLEEFAARHFERLTIQKVELDAGQYFTPWLDTKPRNLVVMGAFGRSGISRLFRKSLANDIIVEHQFPVFVSHK